MYIVSYGSTSSTTLSIFPPDAVSPLLLLCQGQNRELPISRVPKCAYIHGTLAQASHASALIRLIRLVFSAGTVFFSHKKSANSVFQLAYNSLLLFSAGIFILVS
jgi:hypothetical protein